MNEKPETIKKSTTGFYHGQYAATTIVGYTDYLKKKVKWYLKNCLGKTQIYQLNFIQRKHRLQR